MTMPYSRTSLSLLAGGALLAVGALLAWQLIGTPPPSPLPPPAEGPSLQPTPGLPWFVDVAARKGVHFRHFDSVTSMQYIQETAGSGIGWIDYNNDGWPDLFCVQDLPIDPQPGAALPSSRLYRNNGDGTFTDVTELVGLDRPGFGMGCAVGDFDNDGYDDLVVTYLDGVALYHNEPDGKGGRHFVDVTEKAGIKNPHWATSCAWGDIDGDGLLDLYVCNYVVLDMQKYPDCTDKRTGARGSCSPVLFANTPHKLYRNNGNGTFTDVSESSGIGTVRLAPGLGVVIVDLDGDGLQDIFVTNDLKPQYLFQNLGKGRFKERALLSGCGMDGSNTLIAGMGVAAGDLDGSGRPSLFVTNFQARPNILFQNDGNLFFRDLSYPSGLARLDRLGFGTVLLDADLDGHLDIAIANGHVARNAPQITGDPYAQTAQLYLGDGKGKFREVSEQAGAYFRASHVGRGLAYADYDNDGRPDLAFSNNGEQAALLHNETETKNAWIRLELIGDGKKSNRNAVGARVEVESGGQKQVRWVIGGGSYLSASERRLLVGLGSAERVERVTVVWPSGGKQEFTDLEGRKWWRLHEGQEKAELIVPGPAKK